VLCHDEVTTGFKYAQVLKVTSHVDAKQWVTITLCDGTTLKVTVDHPFVTGGSAQNQNTAVAGHLKYPVPASALKPGCDTVMVLKSVPVLVRSVALETPTGVQERARVSVMIEQPSRHSIYVASPNERLPTNWMAVGAANLEPMGLSFQYRRTFLEFAQDMPSLRRSNSSPGRLCVQDFSALLSSPRDDSDIQNASTSSAVSSATAASADDCRIRIGSINAVHDGSSCASELDHGKESVANLQEILSLQRLGLPSVGSVFHTEGKCGRVCCFENKRQHGLGARCSAGALCDRCHCDHALLRRKRRAGDA
jgi:hypothetical protein